MIDRDLRRDEHRSSRAFDAIDRALTSLGQSPLNGSSLFRISEDCEVSTIIESVPTDRAPIVFVITLGHYLDAFMGSRLAEYHGDQTVEEIAQFLRRDLTSQLMVSYRRFPLPWLRFTTTDADGCTGSYYVGRWLSRDEASLYPCHYQPLIDPAT